MTKSIRVLLIANYVPDGQRSMLRFAKMLQTGLQSEVRKVETLHPPVVFGHLGATGHGAGKWLGYIDKYLIFPFLLTAKIRSMGKDAVIHVCDHSNAIYCRWIQRTPHLVTCHDLLAVRSARGEFVMNPLKASGRHQQTMILKGLMRSCCIASVSAATRDDLRRLAGDRKEWEHVIPNALDDPFISEAAVSPDLNTRLDRGIVELPEGARYVMHIGGSKWYKNRDAVLCVFREMAAQNPSLHLIAVGNPITLKNLEATGCRDFENRIHSISGISDDDLMSLYQCAELLLFPSWIEGFGWPILEAQACGCAVATLDRAPMNELNSIPELRLDTETDDSNWAKRSAARCLQFIENSAGDENRRTEVKVGLKAFARRFSPESMIQSYLALYETILSNGRHQ